MIMPNPSLSYLHEAAEAIATLLSVQAAAQTERTILMNIARTMSDAA
jgi:hypothetical protein